MSCLADHKSDILEYYQEVYGMTEIQIETFPSNYLLCHELAVDAIINENM